jgi:type IV pilus assembly protein PilQ
VTAFLFALLALAQDPGGAVQEPEATGPGFTTTQEGTLEFHARDMDVRDAFRQLRTLTRRNIVVAQNVGARFSGDLYDLTAEQAIEMICLGAALRASDRGTYVFIEPAQFETRIYELRYARAADLASMITPMLNEDGRVTASTVSQRGLAPTAEEGGADDYAAAEVLIVRDLPENLDRIERLVRTLDVEPRQVMVEAVILSAQLDDGLELGISFDKLAGVGYQGIGASSAAGFDLSNPPIGSGELDDGFARGSTDLTSDVSEGGLSIGWINGNAAAFVRAVQNITDTRILANTKIVALNKQRGQLLLGRRDGYVTTTTTETTTTQTVEFLETGTQLIFRPFIGEDGMIRLELHPEDSDGGINDLGLPFEETAEITTNILVKDGQTVVIGGLFRERNVQGERKVPVLGDIPLAGNLFRSRENTTTREELIILLTPHVIDPSHYGEAARELGEPADLLGFEGLLDELWREAAADLAAAGDHGSALILLGQSDDRSPEAADEIEKARRQIYRGLVPSFSPGAVDARIAESAARPDPNARKEEKP